MKNNLLREPLLHFFALGLMLFVLYAVVSDDYGQSTEEIVIDQARIAGLVAAFEATWRRQPTEATATAAWTRPR